MSENKTIKNFSAADIEKYWNRKLSSAEMHEMEKAAIDDPFLADALEGYQFSKNTEEELKTLAERFDKKVNDSAPVIPFYRKKYPWLRVAAAIIILVGAGLGVQQLVLKNRNQASLAVKNEDKRDKVQNDVVAKSPVVLDTLKDQAISAEPIQIKPENKTNVDLNSSYAQITIDSLKKADRKTDANADGIKDLEVSANANVIAKETEKKIEDEKKEATDDKAATVNQAAVTPKSSNRSDVNSFYKTKELADNNKQNGLLLNNSYNYRVVDAQNNPVPFANVLNTRDNVGTYTDVRGNFNLVSSDSILNVQVRSLGYNSENYRLVPSKQTNDLVLKEDATARNNMLMDNPGRRVMSSAVRKDSAEVEEPEVGWGNYNTYVENNIKIPEKIRAKDALNQVELSFDIDKTGTPINIKVTKSSKCKECDEEAIRVLKEGPKWKKKGKKSKTTISISVDQK